MQDDVLRAFQRAYAAELARLAQQTDRLHSDYEGEQTEASVKFTNLRAEVLRRVGPSFLCRGDQPVTGTPAVPS